MFFLLSKILDVFLEPLTWVLLLLALVAVRVRPKSREELRKKKLVFFAPIAAWLLLYAFSTRPMANALTRSLESAAPSTFHADVTYDAVIVLSGMVDASASDIHGSVSFNDNVERLLVAYDLLRDGRAKYAILSGTDASRIDSPRAEAAMLAGELAKWGVARDRLIVEARALNTRDNAVESARIAREKGWTKLLVVTSAFHMKRAAGCFRAVGLQVDTLPVDWRASAKKGLLPRADALAESSMGIREHAGWLVYRARGWAVP